MPSKRILLVACTLLAMVLVGCQTAIVKESTLPKFGGDAPEQQLDFWHEVATRNLVSNDEAFHGLLLYLDGKDAATSYEARVATLRSRGLLPGGFSQPGNQALQRGTLAVALVKTLKIQGGLTMRLFGNSAHYATRELDYRGVYPRSSENQIFTGAEFVGVIGKAEDFRQGDPTNLPAAVAPEQAVAQAKADDAVMPILAMFAPQVPELSLSPATTTASSQPAGPIKVIITAVDGLASVRMDENSPWQPAKKGMELSEKSEFRTGPRGSIQFVIPPDQTVSVDRLTTLKVLKVIQEGGKVTTDLGIKYGRTRYDLEGGGLEHQSTLRSPNATLAVRGTKVSLFDQPPFAPKAVSLTGRAEFKAYRKRSLAFGNKGQGKTIVSDSSETAGALALSQTVVDPTLAGARTESEAALLASVISRGATTELDRDTGIQIVRGGVPPNDRELIPVLPGRLNFVLRWDAPANLDLGLSTPATDKNPGGEFIYPAAGLNIGATSGKTAFDHRGGTKGGIEVVYFDKFVDGVYAMGGPNLTKGTVVTATLEAFLDGKNVPLFDGLQATNVITQTVTSEQPALGLVFVNTPTPVIPQFKKATGTRSPRFVGPLPVNPTATPAAKKKK